MTTLDRRHRRILPKARRLAKQAWVRFDVRYTATDASVRHWVPALAGARDGHVVVPSRGVLASRAEALDFVAHGLVKPGDRVLDVGAGNGRQAIGLLEMGVADYVGLDVVKASIDHANKTMATLGPARFVHFDVVNDMYNPAGTMAPEEATFPFADEEFDFVVAGSLYTHLERIEVVERYIAETARVLRPGGHAYMSFFRSPPNEVTDSAVRTVFEEKDVRTAIEAQFVIESDHGGTTTDWHDQWRLYLVKF